MDKNELIEQYKQKKALTLIGSLALDFFGMSTYLIPGFGEFADVVIAPIITVLSFIILGGVIGSFLTFTEEILPGTDIIPSVTLRWMFCFVINGDKSLEKFVAKKIKEKKNLEKIGEMIDRY